MALRGKLLVSMLHVKELLRGGIAREDPEAGIAEDVHGVAARAVLLAENAMAVMPLTIQREPI